jgi:protein TonB
MKSPQLKATLFSLGIHGALVLAMLFFLGENGGGPGRFGQKNGSLSSGRSTGSGILSFVTVAKPIGKPTRKSGESLRTKTGAALSNTGIAVAAKSTSLASPSPSQAGASEGSTFGNGGDASGSDGVRMLAEGKPGYPPLSRQLGEEGDVILRFKIGTTGTVLRTDLDNSSGYSRLDQSALEFSKSVRFILTRALAAPIEKRVTFVFRLE